MKKILLIEDNDDIRNNTAELLELSNYKVIVAKNGKEGVEKAIEYAPDLIICDIMMPVLDGYGVLHALHKNENIKNTPFIFLTAKTDHDDMRRGMEAGADDYITKPFNGTELLNAVDSRLRKLDALKQEWLPGPEGIHHVIESSLGKEALLHFTEGRNINKYKKKQLIYAEGNHPNRLYYLIKGKAKAYKTNDDGKELVTELFSPGEFIGYIALLEGTNYKDSAKALEDTEIAVIPKEDFDDLLNNNPGVMKKFLQLLAKNISSKEDQLLGIAYHSLRKKVAEALILLHRKFQKKNEPFVIDMNRESLAAIAGTAKESLIRTLCDFRDEHLIDIGSNGAITILNLPKIEHLVN
ncbi:MAG: response regulator [Bacteroidetes bacterium]|nr:response regulator [Bacteroidota bacterium]